MFVIVDESHELRREVELSISRLFDREHGASLAVFPPTLVAWLAGGEVAAAASVRFAAEGFFSECYLDAPVEHLIGRKAGLAVGRSEVVEVGSLAAPHPGATLALVAAIIASCHEAGCRWAFFTATARLRALLRRSGILQIELAAAAPDRVASPEAWGRYYLGDPRVVAVGAHMLGGRCALPAAVAASHA